MGLVVGMGANGFNTQLAKGKTTYHLLYRANRW